MQVPALELWQAETFVKVFQGGRTLPLQLEAFQRDSTGKKQTLSLLTKSVGHPDVSDSWSLIAEIIGNLLANYFGIKTPKPALVLLTPDFVQAVQSDADFQRQSQGRIKLAPGIAAGCEYLKGNAPITPVVIDLPKDQETARRIFAYDMLVQNPDRRKDNANAFLYNGEPTAYDFELCFSFLRVLSFARQPAWQIDDRLAQDHLFFAGLRGKYHDWQPFRDALALLDCDMIKQTFGELLEVFPVTNTFADQVVRHLQDVQSHQDHFLQELERSLK